MSPALRCTAGLLPIAVFAPDHQDLVVVVVVLVLVMLSTNNVSGLMN